MVPADLDEPEELRAAMNGVDTVFHLAGHYPRTGLHPAGDLQIGVSRMKNVLDSAAVAGVRRLVYVSSTATVAPARDGPSTERDTFAATPGFGSYHDLKWALEQLALTESRFEVSVLCPGACLGAWDLRVGTSALIVATARSLAPPHPDGWVSIVDARDVADACMRVATHSRPPRRLLLAGSNHRLQGLLQQLAARYGAAPPSAPLSATAARREADEAERRAEQTRERPAIAREIVDLVVHGVPVDASLARSTYGISFRPLEDTLDCFDSFALRFGLLPPRTPEIQP